MLPASHQSYALSDTVDCAVIPKERKPSRDDIMNSHVSSGISLLLSLDFALDGPLASAASSTSTELHHRLESSIRFGQTTANLTSQLV